MVQQIWICWFPYWNSSARMQTHIQKFCLKWNKNGERARNDQFDNFCVLWFYFTEFNRCCSWCLCTKISFFRARGTDIFGWSFILDTCVRNTNKFLIKKAYFFVLVCRVLGVRVSCINMEISWKILFLSHWNANEMASKWKKILPV